MDHTAAIEVLTAEALRLQRLQIKLQRAWNDAIRQPPSKYSPAAVDLAEAAQAENHKRVSDLRATIRQLERCQPETVSTYAARIR